MSVLIIFITVNVILFQFCSAQISYNEVKDLLPERPQPGGYLNYPGVEYEPNPPSEQGLIYLHSKRNFSVYTDRLQSLLEKYDLDNVDHKNLINCSSYTTYRPRDTWNKSCIFDTNVFGDSYCVKESLYGYEDFMPCIALRLDRILNWLPEPYTNSTVPDKIRNAWKQYSVTVLCEGEDPVSKDNLGEISYYPQEGVAFKYFPDIGHAGWMNPLVMVHLENLAPAVAVRVTCSVYAKNIVHNDQYNTGKVSFDVMIQ